MAEIVNDIETLGDAISAGAVFIWNGNTAFHSALEEALRGINNQELKTKLKGCENKSFENGIILYKVGDGKKEEKIREFKKN